MVAIDDFTLQEQDIVLATIINSTGSFTVDTAQTRKQRSVPFYRIITSRRGGMARMFYRMSEGAHYHENVETGKVTVTLRGEKLHLLMNGLREYITNEVWEEYDAARVWAAKGKL